MNKYKNTNDIFPSTVFTRNGNTYSAVIELADGEPITSWPDDQKWLLQIKDTNDSDGDGIPDLSALGPLPPTSSEALLKPSTAQRLLHALDTPAAAR